MRKTYPSISNLTNNLHPLQAVTNYPNIILIDAKNQINEATPNMRAHSPHHSKIVKYDTPSIHCIDREVT